MELLVTTAQLLNCITATGNLDVTSVHCPASRSYFPRGFPQFCRPAGHRRVPCFRFSKRSIVVAIGYDFPVSVLIPTMLLDYVSRKEVRRADYWSSLRTSTQDVRRCIDCCFNVRARSHRTSRERNFRYWLRKINGQTAFIYPALPPKIACRVIEHFEERSD